MSSFSLRHTSPPDLPEQEEDLSSPRRKLLRYIQKENSKPPSILADNDLLTLTWLDPKSSTREVIMLLRALSSLEGGALAN